MSWNDLMVRTLPRMMPSMKAPPGLGEWFRTKRSERGRQWMRRNEVEEGDVRKGGWNLLVLALLAGVTILMAAVIVGGPGTLMYVLLPILLFPLIACALYMNIPETFAQAEERRMLREGPSAIGCITMSMQVTPSLEHAVAFASERGDGVLTERLKEAMWSNQTRTRGSLNEALEDMTSSLAETNASLRQAFHLVISSTCERTKEGMDRLLDKANSVVLSGVRDAVESYVASLSMPTMVLFALGTLLPIMLFSILPLLSLGTSIGAEGAAAVPLPHLAFLLLAVIPGAALAYSWSILSRNPLGMVKGGDLRGVVPAAFIVAWAGIVIVAAAVDLGQLRPYALSGAIILPPCAFIVRSMRGRSSGRRKEAIEREATHALFQIGNRMLSGATLEKALEDVTNGMGRGPFPDVVKAILYRSMLSGEKLDRIIMEQGSLRDASVDLENAYVTVARCAERDPRYAGQIALNMARMLTDLKACQGKVEERLRGVVEMMRSTGTFFAPIVLGVTGALFALIGTRTADASGMASDIVLITGIYIGELSFLVSFFTVLLMGERSWKGVAKSYAVRTPIAFAVFVAVSFICRTGLTALL